MANYDGINNALYDTGGVSTIGQGQTDARVKAMREKYTILGSETSGSTIQIGTPLPKGAKVLAVILKVSANQSSLTVSVGDGETATRYASASTVLQTAGTYIIGGAAYAIGTIALDDQITLTTGGATASAGTLYVDVLYTID